MAIDPKEGVEVQQKAFFELLIHFVICRIGFDFFKISSFP